MPGSLEHAGPFWLLLLGRAAQILVANGGPFANLSERTDVSGTPDVMAWSMLPLEWLGETGRGWTGMEEPEMERKEMWMPPMYSRGPLYTYELTSRAAEEIDEELFAQLFGPIEDLPSTCSPANRLDESRREIFVSYCMELDCWHEDLGFLLFEMDTSVRYIHPERLDRKRLAILYHTDNFYFRIHAYREKVFQLVSVFLGLAIPDRHPQFNDKVLEELKSRGLGELNRLLSDLSSDPMLVEAIGRRNPFAHRLARRDWEKRDWSSLQSNQRINDQITNVSESDWIERFANFESFHFARLEEFGRICERLAEFRDGLVAALKASCP